MYWLIPLAIVAAAAWAVRWQFRDVEQPQPARVRIVELDRRRSETHRRRAA